jgi:dienelactone hydrolase
MSTPLLLVVCGVVALTLWRVFETHRKRAVRIVAIGVGLLVVAVCVGVWVLPAVPTLPAPDGRYRVGTEVYRWIDSSRGESHTSDPADRRAVIAQFWYPAESSAATAGVRLPYLDGADRLPSRVSGVPAFVMRRYGEIDSHADAHAPLARSDRPWPVVLLSPGYGAPRAVYTGLATQLSSRGFVVVAIDHPYESGVTQLPEGRVVGTQEPVMTGPSSRSDYMAAQRMVRSADIRFVIDQLARPEQLSSRPRGGGIEASRVAVIGHSFGGAAAALVMTEDARVAAAANIDGTPYGDLLDRVLTRPFLLLESDLDETPHGRRYHEGNGKLLARATAPAFRYELKRVNHYSFTDALFFVAPPGRWVIGQLIGGAREPAETQRIAAVILSMFLSGPLTGEEAELGPAVRRNPNVVGASAPGRDGSNALF